MHYALYRKYRPKTFEEVVGQDHVTKTLKAQIKSGQFSHSYLFTGTRGTGKTSCAKILARAVNCLSPKDGEPCNECDICKGLLSGEIYDVVEMDAASNNSVDNIRQIRDEIMFTPMKTKYKVYIIDEVHMLSSGAFNALLKTLEEPPEHVIFILATTEAHKIPATILSRCQRFDMHRLSLQKIAEHLKNIAKMEGRAFPDDIIYMIASLADGSVRDSLSILDKVMETEDPYMIKETLGICDSDLLFSLSEAVVKSDIDSLFGAVSDFYTESRDFSVLLHGLLEHFRFLLMARTSSSPEKFIEKSKEDVERYKKQAPLFGIEQILYILDTLRNSLVNLSRSSDKRAETEICLLKCAKPELSKGEDVVSARISKIENKLSDKSFTENLFKRAAENKEFAKNESDCISENFNVRDTVSSNREPLKNSAVEKTKSFIPEKDAADITKKTAISSAPNYFDDFENSDEIPSVKDESPFPGNKSYKVDSEQEISDNKNSEYKEFLSFKTLASYARKKDVTLGLALSRSCEAVYKDKELIILCKNEKDREEVSSPSARKIIEDGLREDCKSSYKVKFEIGVKENYLSENQRQISDLYENLEDSDLFSF